MNYRGSCHCGAVRFSFESEPIVRGVRCNCSICRRRGAVMSDRYFDPASITVELAQPLGIYHWGDRDMNHWFCTTCGIHPFADPVAKPGHYRVNLGCVDGLDTFALEIQLIDGASF